MRRALIDTDILSMFLRGDNNVVSAFTKYLAIYPTVNISILTNYEILSGLKYKDANRQMATFLALSKILSIIPVTEASTRLSAEIYAELRKNRSIIDDVDILIAGICLENNFVLITNYTKHFSRVDSLELDNWSLAASVSFP